MAAPYEPRYERFAPGEDPSAATQQGTKLPFIPNLPISVRKDRSPQLHINELVKQGSWLVSFHLRLLLL